MAWCPKCKCEYVEGVTICADCGCELVDKLQEEQPEPELTQQDALAMIQAVKESGKDIPEELFEEMEGAEEFFSDEDEPSAGYQSPYVNNEEKAEENRTSAYTLLTVGGAGLIVIALFFLGIIDFGTSLTNKYMITGVMGVLFILFIVMGIVSLKNSKILTKKAHKENNLTAEIKKWCIDNLKEKEIDQLLSLEQQSLELKYFQRFDYMKKAIQKQFMNLDESYLDRLIEEVYADIFEEENE